MNKKLIIIGLILLSVTSVVAITNRTRILLLLETYEEECLEYKVVNWTELHCKDWSSGYSVKMFNKTHKYKWSSWTCDELVFWYTINKTIFNITDECIKYHLVREVN